eukprot:55260-Eustigmatos_ZCMA.PRE.1
MLISWVRFDGVLPPRGGSFLYTMRHFQTYTWHVVCVHTYTEYRRSMGTLASRRKDREGESDRQRISKHGL